MLAKQAKILTDGQIKAVLSYLESTRNASRNKVMFLLSLHGLRAKEVSALEISMVTDAGGSIGEAIALEDKACKGKSGRLVYMNRALKLELENYLKEREDHPSKYLIVTERSDRFSANSVAIFFRRVYKSLGFEGASSHSGRRTYIHRAAKKIFAAGGSLKDVQALAGHRHLSTTQRYIEQDVDAQRKVAALLY